MPVLVVTEETFLRLSEKADALNLDVDYLCDAWLSERIDAEDMAASPAFASVPFRQHQLYRLPPD